jgi:hypothetical protein
MTILSVLNVSYGLGVFVNLWSNFKIKMQARNRLWTKKSNNNSSSSNNMVVVQFREYLSMCWLNSKNASCKASTKSYSSHRMELHASWYLSIYQKSVKKIKVSLKSGTLHEDLCLCYLDVFFLRMGVVSVESCRECENTHFMFSNFSPKIVTTWKYGTAKQVTHDYNAV